MLNHLGLCMSYVQTWHYLTKLSEESQFLMKIQQSHMIFVYDNFNIHHRVRHEREGNYNLMCVQHA